MLVYLHIPYCDSKCHYCSFNSYVGKFDTRRRYMKALETQLRFELERFGATKESVQTLFIGGGTPSTVDAALYAPIFELLAPYLQSDAEITVEANPNSATETWLQEMRDLGTNRISFGVQSFDADKLRRLNRAHTPAQAIRAVETAAEAGFAHLSIDLIYNCAGDSQALLANDIRTALSLPIDHLSAYELTIEAGTPFAERPQMRQENESLAYFVAETLLSHGFAHYEISNFGRYRSRHNLGYWRYENYIGAGAGAVGFLHDTRFYPHSDIDAYVAAPLHVRKESLTPQERTTERIFLGLRSIVGIDATILNETMRARAEILCEANKLVREKGRYYNPNFFLADEIALYLLA